MSKNTNLSFLTDYITADITNGRIGINNASPAFAFDVTGTARVSTSLNINTASSGYTTPSLLVNAGAGTAIPLQAIADSTGGRLFRFYTSDFNNTTTGTSIRLNFGAATGNTSANLQVYTGGEQVVAGTILALQPSGGNVGIGTSTPLDTYTGRTVLTINNNGAFGAFLNFGYNGSLYGFICQNTDILQIGTQANIPMSFGTNANERMRITSGGNVGIGGTTPAVKLQIDGTNNQERLRLRNTDSVSYLSFSEQNITMWRPNDSGSAFVLQTQPISGTWTGGGGGIEFRPLNTLRMTISPTGNIGAPSGTNIYNASDARLKKNISKIAYGLDAISALNPVKFNWIDGFEPSEDGKYMLGFVAQEVLEILPEAVELFGGDINLNGEIITTPLRVNEKFIIPVLVKAIQELKAEINLLKQK
jgi:hypothetical protein